MTFGGNRGGNVLDTLLERLGMDPEDLEEIDGDLPDRIGSGPEIKRVPLSGLGRDWFCPVVSLVKKGQVPKARIIALKSHVEEEEGMAAASNEKFLAAIIRAALGRPETDDLAVLEAKLEALEPTPGQEDGVKVSAVATKSLHGGERAPDRDPLGRRLDKPYAPRTAGRY